MKISSIFFKPNPLIALIAMSASLICLILVFILLWKEKEKEQELRSDSVEVYSDFLEDSEAFEAYRQMLCYAIEFSGVINKDSSEEEGG